jgi:plasmid stabilization system protein ParE
MKKYTVQVSPRARLNILKLEYLITYLYGAPLTAKRYVEGLYAQIQSIATYPESIKISDKKDVLRYGVNARAIRYKKMLIVYTVHDAIVVIETVMPASMVIE